MRMHPINNTHRSEEHEPTHTEEDPKQYGHAPFVRQVVGELDFERVVGVVGDEEFGCVREDVGCHDEIGGRGGDQLIKPRRC